jgi:hypothetical protein
MTDPYGARLTEHAVAVSDEVGAIGVVPGNRALLQRVEPIKKDLRIGPNRVGGVSALNSVLVKKGHYGLDDLHRVREEERKPLRSRLSQGVLRAAMIHRRCADATRHAIILQVQIVRRMSLQGRRFRDGGELVSFRSHWMAPSRRALEANSNGFRKAPHCNLRIADGDAAGHSRGYVRLIQRLLHHLWGGGSPVWRCNMTQPAGQNTLAWMAARGL